MEGAEFNLGEVAIGPVSSRPVDGRLGLGIDRESIASRINDFHFVYERLPEIGREGSRIVAIEAKENGDRWLRGPCALISASDFE
jgi:hypothetical protein